MLTLFASALIKVMPSMIRTNQIISKISTTHKSVEIINDLKNLYIREKDQIIIKVTAQILVLKMKFLFNQLVLNILRKEVM